MTASESASSPQVEGNRTRPKVLYVLGTQRGGTTIAGRLMGQVPGFAFLGEFRKLWQVGLPEGRRCGCGKSYDECEVWSVVIPKVLGATDVGLIKSWQQTAAPDRLSSLHAWRLARAGGQGQSAAVRSYAALLAAAYVSLAETMQKRVLVDTSKLPADAVIVSRLETVDSFFLELVRDPRGTVYSTIRRSGKPAGFHPRQGVAGSAGWLVRHLAASALRREVGPSRSMVVTYERLVADPQQVLSEIAGFVGEPGSKSDLMVGGNVPLDLAHTPIGDGRFGPVCVEFTQDDRWITALSTADRLLVSALTRPLARHFGYCRPRLQ